MDRFCLAVFDCFAIGVDLVQAVTVKILFGRLLLFDWNILLFDFIFDRFNNLLWMT